MSDSGPVSPASSPRTEVLHELCTADLEYAERASTPRRHVFLINLCGDHTTALTNVWIGVRAGGRIDDVLAAHLALTEGDGERFASLGTLDARDDEDDRIRVLEAWETIPLPLGQLAVGARLALVVHARASLPHTLVRFSADVVPAPPEYAGRLRRSMKDGCVLRVAQGAIVNMENATDALQFESEENDVDAPEFKVCRPWTSFASSCPRRAAPLAARNLPPDYSSSHDPVASTAA